MLKKLLALLMVLTLLCALAACTDPETPNPAPNDPSAGLEDPAPMLVKSGDIADCELTWELYTDGALYIRGMGPMAEFESNSSISTRQPWQEYIANENGSYTVKKVFVENGVTSLSEGAFQGCINLETAEIATSVTVIPAKCFNRCSVLRTVRAKGVIEIADAAFQNCERLTTVTVNASLQIVWDGAFSACATLSNNFAVRLAGNAEEWAAAKAKMNESTEDEFAIWTGNEIFLAALEKVTFVSK